AAKGLAPEPGRVCWWEPLERTRQSQMSISTPRLAGDELFITSFYDGSLMLKLARDKPAEKVLWKAKGKSERADQTKALQSIMCTPVIKDGYIYGVCRYGPLRCLGGRTREPIS